MVGGVLLKSKIGEVTCRFLPCKVSVEGSPAFLGHLASTTKGHSVPGSRASEGRGKRVVVKDSPEFRREPSSCIRYVAWAEYL